MVDFAGWSMPVQYSSIVTEHNATRNSVGLFDVSHMGRIRFDGPDSQLLLDHIVTRKVAGMRPGQIRYALVTGDDGGILDDVLVYHLHDASGLPFYELVVNASNRPKIWNWLETHRGTADADLLDTTHETAMIAVQGPRALELIRSISRLDPAELRYYHGAETELSGNPGILSRTGYTGEDGCELIVPASAALEIWEQLYAAAEKVGGTAAGLGCRDTLRLEAGMPLYGHELSEQIDPFQAGLGYAVDLAGRHFPGHDVLLARSSDTSAPQRVGWELDGKRVAREGHVVIAGGQPVGHVTSGTFSPTLEKPIAMGYLKRELTSPGTEMTVDIRGQQVPARVVSLPFYRRLS